MRSEPRLEASERAIFWSQLQSLLRAGLGLPEALAAIARDAGSPSARALVESLRTEVEQGEPLSTALARRPGQFDEATVACAEAGERSGDLPGAAGVLAGYGHRVHMMRLRGRMVLTYPVILLGVCMFTFTIFSRMILPVMERLYSGLGQGAQMPLLTTTAVVLVQVMSVVTPLLLLALAGSVIAYRRHGRFTGFRRRIDGILLRIPLWSRYYRSLALARFTRTLGVLLGSGIPLHEALEIAGGAGGNLVLREEASDAARAVRDGGRAADTLRAGPALPESLVWALRVSEDRGDLEETLGSLADYFDESAAIGSETFLNTIEPGAVLVLGIIIAVAIIGVVYPTFDLIRVVGY